MPRRKKKAHELTTDEAMRKLFPREVVKAAKQEAENARKSDGKTTTRKQST
jgi:hypothetical protein